MRKEPFSAGGISGVVRTKIGADVLRSHIINGKLPDTISDEQPLYLLRRFADFVLQTEDLDGFSLPDLKAPPVAWADAFERWCNLPPETMEAWLTADYLANQGGGAVETQPDADPKN